MFSISNTDVLLFNCKGDVVLTDPPYGMKDRVISHKIPRKGKREGANNTWHKKTNWDNDIDPNWLPHAQTLAPVIFWFGVWNKRVAVENSTFKLRAELIWSKNCHAGPPCPFARKDERIWFLSKKAVKGNHFETTVLEEKIIPTFNRKWHKNEKPVNLLRRLIKWMPCDVVVDPFMGSGSTGVAAILEGKTFIGNDFDADYCVIAEQRMKHAQEFGKDLRPNKDSKRDPTQSYLL